MEIIHTVKPRKDTGLYNAKLGIWLFLASEVMLFGALFSTYIILRTGAPETGPAAWPLGMDLLNVPMATFNTILLISSSVTVILAWANMAKRNLGKARAYLGITVLLACGFLVVKYFEYSAKFHHYRVVMNNGDIVSGHIDTADGEEFHGTMSGFDGTVKSGDGENMHVYKSFTFVPDAKTGEHGHPEAITIKSKDVARLTNYLPKHSNFMGIYWTMTGLHVLHVIGGILVMAYFLLPGWYMAKSEAERFTNRLEVAGLYWHFVDLVWIFLFPTLYLL